MADGAVISQTNMKGTATGSSLMLTGSIFDTVVGVRSRSVTGRGHDRRTQSGNNVITAP
jgi:hypothetical protein